MFIDDFGMVSPGIGLNGTDLLGQPSFLTSFGPGGTTPFFCLRGKQLPPQLPQTNTYQGSPTWREYLRSLTQRALKSTT